MTISSHNYYNLNATRGFPLDDSATGLSDAGLRLPDGILVDGCLRFPRTLGQYAYLMAMHATSKLVSCVVGVAETLDDAELTPIAALSIPTPLSSGRPYQLKPLLPGVGGWFVFGPPDNDYTGRFSLPRQSLLLPHIARPYEPLPVPWVSKVLDEHKLEQLVTLFAGTDVEILRDTRTIDGEQKDAIVMRLTGDLPTVLARYVGPCGGRPGSGSCLTPALESLGSAIPDASGDIQMDFEGLTAAPVPNGLLLNTALRLPELCGSSFLEDDTTPTDYCSEISEISEISESDGGSDSESEAVSSESSDVIVVSYPKCVRIFSTEEAPFDYPYGVWTKTAVYPPEFPCTAEGKPTNTWRSLHAGVAPVTVDNPLGSHVAIFNEPEYLQSFDMRVETTVRVADNATIAGLLFGYRQRSGYPKPDAMMAYIDPGQQRLGLGTWAPNQVDQQIQVISPLRLSEWYKIIVWISNTAYGLELRLFMDYLPDIGSPVVSTGFPVSIQTTLANGWPQMVDGRFGFFSTGPSTDFGYLHMDQI